MAADRPPDELSATLQRLRDEAGLSLRQVAALVDMSAATVNRLEKGAYLPTPEQAEALARAVNAPPAERRRVVALAKELQARTTPRQVLRRGAAAVHKLYGDIEKASGHVRSFSPVMPPGQAQAPAYIRQVLARLPASQFEGAVRQREMRGQALWAPTGPRHTIVMAEGALLWHAGSPAVMADQCDHLAYLARTAPERVRVGIIPWTRPVDEFPLHSFDLYDERAVIYGTRTGTAFVTAPPDVAGFVRLFRELAGLAVFGEDAARIADRRADEYRNLLNR